MGGAKGGGCGWVHASEGRGTWSIAQDFACEHGAAF